MMTLLARVLVAEDLTEILALEHLRMDHPPEERLVEIAAN